MFEVKRFSSTCTGSYTFQGVEVFGRRVGWGGVSDMSYNCQPVYISKQCAIHVHVVVLFC